jgi:hypothetical protein
MTGFGSAGEGNIDIPSGVEGQDKMEIVCPLQLYFYS